MDDKTSDNEIPSTEILPEIWDPDIDAYYDITNAQNGAFEFRKETPGYLR